jgi:hypothetical protein
LLRAFSCSLRSAACSTTRLIATRRPRHMPWYTMPAGHKNMVRQLWGKGSHSWPESFHMIMSASGSCTPCTETLLQGICVPHQSPFTMQRSSSNTADALQPFSLNLNRQHPRCWQLAQSVQVSLDSWLHAS